MSTNSKIGNQYGVSQLLKHIPDSQIMVEAAIRSGKSLTALIEPQTPSMQRITLAEWKNALISAQNVDSPNRVPLFRVYDNIRIDNTLTSIIDTRILKVQQAKFMLVDKAGKPDTEAKKLLEKEWFQSFIANAMESRFEGYSLVECFDFDPVTGELIRTVRVNKFHVNPPLGIVSKIPGDDKGFPYIDNPYYIPVGDKMDLGMLYKAAPHILAKKFALGTWAEYNEKIGIPFRTVHTNSTDKGRQAQLGVIMDKMGSAGWAVLTEGEKVELLAMAGTDPTKCFEALIAKLDSEIAMLILGQSATSNSQNNKGTYGSMQMLQGISDDRHESDQVFLKYLINGVLMPRLALLSPAYKSFANLYFEWDKSEDLNVKDTVDYVVKLSDVYEIDPEFITKKTGIPIIGMKKVVEPGPTPTPIKKKSLTANITAFYKDKCCDDHLPVAINKNGFEPDVLRIAKALFEGKQTGVVDMALMKKTAAELREGLLTGYTTSPDEKNKDMFNALDRNIYVFSGFKTYQQLRDISDKLTDDNGNKRSFEEFKKEVLKVNQTYNVRHLNAEYNHSIVSSQMASQWLDIQANKKILPFLKFDATLDRNTTNTCRNLDGFTARVDDPIWETYYLPLHWGERSVIMQMANGTVSDQSKISFPELQDMFKGNVGIDGVIFPKNHPYYEASKADQKEIMKAVNKLFPDPADVKKVYTSKSGGTVSVHSTHQADELKSNTAVAKILADNKHDITLLSYAEGRKNPDASIDGIVCDFKKNETGTRSAIQTAIKRAAKQEVSIVVISLPKDIKNNEVVSGLYMALQNEDWNKSITEAWFITAKKKLIKVKRSEITERLLKKVL